MEKIDIKTFSLKELEEEILALKEPKFRAKQIFNWLHQKHIESFDEMTNLSKDLRQKLNEKYKITEIEILDTLKSKEDGTTKFLFKLEGNNVIESVLMKYSYGNAVCISSQVGCRMGCTFCASTLDGLERNLTVAEMLSQIYKIQKYSGERIRSIVLMGSGEPFDNFDNFKKFIEMINCKEGLELGQRHITVSTCGIVERIYDFANLKTQVNLAISLHAPNNELRRNVMPVARKYTVEEIIEACKYFSDTTKRRVTYEYALISGVNDKEEHAEQIISLLKGTLCHINLIPVNDVKERDYIKSSKAQIKKFSEIIEKSGINVTIRRELGSDINAACGQLRRSYKY
ncbi:MAG: 23S rRNA (adenine(2503)-C(2))-methyltransferase RlmN [Eubacteriales bacterium]|nr:23S rRNA (adenine(2503)-C(2))-methyltransferase RlmN [Eubacteriales bacterium]